ncbi:MAG: EamA family transporter [Phycisphaerales bacterium]|nr:EamA family transporter [Phycisphaerales bacterium]
MKTTAMSASPSTLRSRHASLPALLAGFACIYLVWGSTYLAIKFVVETLPPFITAGVRFLIAGAILWLLAQITQRQTGAPLHRPTFAQFRAAAIVGALMLCGGNGLVCWSQQHVGSGVTALVVGTVPIWMVLLEWVIHRGPRPGALVWVGLALGFCGIAILASHKNGESTKATWAIGALLVACIFWAYGSLRSRRVDQGPSLLQATAMQMLGGGAALLVVGTLLGEWARIDPASISTRSILAVLYLIVIGSLIGFTSYVWLLQVASPTAVSTYAYVNPVVAVFLGWWLAEETVSGWTVLAAVLVIGAVALMTIRRPASAAQTTPNLQEEKSPGIAMPGLHVNR